VFVRVLITGRESTLLAAAPELVAAGAAFRWLDEAVDVADLAFDVVALPRDDVVPSRDDVARAFDVVARFVFL